MPTWWTGAGLQITEGTGEGDLIDTWESTTFGAHLQDGDTIIRWLVEWYLITSLHENSIALATQPLPWVAAVAFTPNYGAFETEVDATSPLVAEVGDALYTERTKWAPVRWTDGTLNSTQWWAASPGVVDIQTERTVREHSVDRVWFGFQDEKDNFGSDVVHVTVSGWMRIKVLVKR
jgi:hypothetical protein